MVADTAAASPGSSLGSPDVVDPPQGVRSAEPSRGSSVQSLPPGPPPGLEELSSLPAGPVQWLQEAREAAVSNASRVFEEKTAEMWRWAAARMQQLEEQHAKSTRLLEEELRACQAKNQLLEEQKAQLQRGVTALQKRMADAEAKICMGSAFSHGVAFEPAGRPGPFSVLGLISGAADVAKYPTLPSFPKLEPLQPIACEEGEDSDSEGVQSPPPGAPASAPAAALPRSVPEETAAPLLLSELVGPCSPQRSPQLRPAPGPANTPCMTRPNAVQRAATPRRSTTTPQQALTTPPRTPQMQGTPKAKTGALTPMKSPVVPASPFVICEDGGCLFGFMLRLADGVDLGLDLVHHDGGDGALHVLGVKPGGAIDSWNRQCVGGPSAGKAVAPGDRVIGVNAAREPQAMLQECREKKMLRFAVVRGQPDCDGIPGQWAVREAQGGHSDFKASAGGLRELPAPPPWVERSPPRSSALRADAFVFVPSSSASAA